MHRSFRLVAAAAAACFLGLSSSGCGELNQPTCGSMNGLPVEVYVTCDHASFAPVDELGETTILVEGRIDDGPWVACTQPYPDSGETLHLCDSVHESDPHLFIFSCGDRLVTEVRATQGNRTAQAFTYYNKLSCIHARQVSLMLTAPPG